MNIVWVGCHEEGILAFRRLLESGRKPSAFITLNKEAFEKRSAGSREYELYCQKYNVPYYSVATIKGQEAYDIIFQYKPDLIVVLGWSEILPERLLGIATIGTVGTHAALLPHNKGSAPINWAIIHGENVTGNTLMWLDAEVDSGEIIDQIEIPITPFDTCKTLYDMVAETNAVMLLSLVENIESGIKPKLLIANETNEAILPRRRPKDGLINWNQPSVAIYNFIRALTDPYPGAFTYLDGKKWLVWKAIQIPISGWYTPGELIGTSYAFEESGNGILVGTGEGIILITEIEDENGVRYNRRNIHTLGLTGEFEYE